MNYRDIIAQEATLSPEEYKALRKSYGLDNVKIWVPRIGDVVTIDGEKLEVVAIHAEEDGETIEFKSAQATTTPTT